MTIDVPKIEKGLDGVSPITAAHLYEAYVVCMHRYAHPETVVLKMESPCQDVCLKWEDRFEKSLERTYADMQYTTEHGAVCLSLMLAVALTPYTIIERSRKGTGFDYWLGEKGSRLFQKKARLEVSGILEGNDAVMASRYSAKALQTERSDQTGLPAYISIIEFSRPKAIFKIKE